MPSVTDEVPAPEQPAPAVIEPDVPRSDEQDRSAPGSSIDSTYGPLRRVRSKAGPPALYRPPAMKEEDFAEVMREIVPKLLEHAVEAESQDESMHAKRQLEDADVSGQPASQKPRVAIDEAMKPSQSSMYNVDHLQDMWDDPSTSVEVLIANFMQKKLSKEIPPTNSSPALQAKVDESKKAEWQTILDKQAVNSLWSQSCQDSRATCQQVHR